MSLTSFPALCLFMAVLAGAVESPRPPRAVPDAPVYVWQLPPGFPPPLVPADNPMSAAKVELGRRLFYDTRLSVSGSYSCATCHQQQHAFTDARGQALGATGALHPRSPMSLANVAYNASYGWIDPALDVLEKQVLQPLLNEHPVEMGLRGHEVQALQALSDDARYPAAFRSAFPDSTQALTLDNIARAIAAFERTLISGRSAFDRRIFDDDTTAMSAAQRRGMALFFSARIGCSACHFGINFSGPVRSQRTPDSNSLFANTALYNLDGLGAYPDDAPGLAARSGRRTDRGKFRVPTLRNIALTAPYMHDGSIATLDEVIEHYAQGGRQFPRGPATRNPRRDARLKGFTMSADERADLLAFLESLTDEAFVADPRFGEPQAR